MPRRIANLARQLRAEYRPERALKALQFKKLERLVHEAYHHTQAYRCLMQRAGVHPSQIKTLHDLERMPLVLKKDLLEFSESERTNWRRIERYSTVRIATSGSSGHPFEFIVDSVGNSWRKAQYLRPYVTNGRRPWHRVLRFTALVQDDKSDSSAIALFRERRLACTAPIEQHLRTLESYLPRFVQGYPSALRCLAFELLRRDIIAPSVETVFTDSELLAPDSRAMIEKAFDAPVLDVFGSYETDNVAYQCSKACHHHFAIDSAILEVVRNGEPIDTGEGDFVVTVFHNLTTPFIRYNLRDVVSRVEEPCSCGRTFPLINIAAGRSDDLVVVAGGERRSPLSFLWRFDAFSDLLREYQITQVEVDKFVVRVVPARPLTPVDNRRVKETIWQDYPRAEVDVVARAQLPRTRAEKLKAFICDVPSAQDGRDGD